MYAIFFHAHQKLDRVAYRHLRHIIDEDIFFPSFKNIMYFEGQRGPDSTNLKNNTNVEQPWHFVNPFDDDDTDLHRLIDGHVERLTKALRDRDETKAAHEAAWMAHALVDGLTPAHHYPYEQEMAEIRGGQSRHDRSGLIGWMYVRGDTYRDSVRKSMQLIGPKGLLTTHTLFEGGAYTIMKPLRLNDALPTADELRDVRRYGVVGMFHRYAREIATHDLYKRFYQTGWTPRLTRDVRNEMIPRMARLVTLAWYACLCDARMVSEP